ncbi:F-box domain protein [Aspergillus nomiae NRRL 13137]|uniref:F-box domain protein n=1 Tax=Aspergillus nomiae NRRL (strain ATCC 15546 / NRRL 13137 / CBS 260.88 / M93) TaxID=1509407 RepID=A0A0L1IYF2_ASPN3|nr:F-box domain protein [Aspergillus nomiae NRRL 13137]KNG84208.1 F-box domain protein [Aspergillus nomiae NRRL 13137]
MTMEEDVRLPSAERLDGPHHDPEQLPSAGSSQQQNGSLGKSQSRSGELISSLFNSLPRTVIEHILYVVDANTFASLAFLNRKWRRISDSPLLYSHHLSRCPSFSLTAKATSDEVTSDDLAILKLKFGAEIRRNAFEVFLRPHQTLVKLISTSMSSSTAFPHGEAFRFAFSPSAQLVLCISSSRIVVLDVASGSAVVRHELKTWRRPLNATILDDGSLLAVVSSSHQVNIYSLSNEEARHVQNIKLNDVPQALALSPTGGVLAIAYTDRIEVYAIGEGTLATERRAVRCAGVDSIAFSSDGVMLLGSSGDSQNTSLVTITVPFYTEPVTDISAREAHTRMWTTQILFPEIIQSYSHACLLPLHTEGDGSWILGFDKEAAAFRAIGTNNVNSGTVYFVSPTSGNGLQESPPIMLPTVDCTGELAALGFQDSGLWVYGIPDRLDIAPSSTLAAALCASDNGPSHRAEEAVSLPDNAQRLQHSIAKPKMLIRGHKMSDMSGITAACWVRHAEAPADHRRLVAVAPGGISPPTIGEEDVPVDGGRVLLLDFERSPKDGSSTEISIEIGETEPKMLHEPNTSLDTEVELERRRTRLHRGNSSYRARTVARESYPAAISMSQSPPLIIRRNSSYFSVSSNDIGDGDTPPVPDTPYDNTQPRSRDTLRRAATAAATSRTRYNPRYRDESRRVLEARPVPPIFQVPHESDADNWVPPPPPYTREPDAPLPEVSDVPDGLQRSRTTRLEDMAEEPLPRTPLQRLNTISGSRLASLVRRTTRASEAPGLSRTQSNLVQRGASDHPYSQNGEVPSVPSAPLHIQPQAIATSQEVDQNTVGNLDSTNLHYTAATTATILPAPVQQASLQETQTESVVSPGELLEWQDAVPEIPDMLPNLNHPYSLSSPNLQFPDPQYASLDIPRDSWLRTGYHRSMGRRPQSQDIRQESPAIPPLNRRASTDPTLSTSSQPSNDLWRRRIEEWNERTITKEIENEINAL